MTNFYKLLGVKKSTAKPGDLLAASKQHKFHKHHKMACKVCGKHHSSSVHDKKHKMVIHTGDKVDEEKTEKLHKSHPMCKIHGVSHTPAHHKAHHKGQALPKHLHRKNWIAGAVKHPGALHRQLGVKQGNKIPAGKLAVAAKKGGKVGRRARLAQTLKGFH